MQYPLRTRSPLLEWVRCDKPFAEADGGCALPGVENTSLEDKLRCKTLSGGREIVRTRVVGFARPIHLRPLRRVLHLVFKRAAHVARYVDGLHFQRAKIENLPLNIVGYQ